MPYKFYNKFSEYYVSCFCVLLYFKNLLIKLIKVSIRHYWQLITYKCQDFFFFCFYKKSLLLFQLYHFKQGNKQESPPVATLRFTVMSYIIVFFAYLTVVFLYFRGWIRAAWILIILLGLTWIFGLFYVNQETIFMAYIFNILNSLQGFFIFIFHCLLNDKVMEYKFFLFSILIFKYINAISIQLSFQLHISVHFSKNHIKERQ